MFARLAAMAALISLAACANMEPAGRNARNGSVPPPEPPRVVASSPQTARPAPVLPPPTTSSAPVTSAAPLNTAPPPSQYALPTRPAPSTPAPAAVATPPVAAPSVAAPAADRPPARNDDQESVAVTGQVQRQVRPPSGDPRSVAERMQDINSWDRCVTHVQAAFESDPTRPQLQSPEEYCAQSLGMANRNAIPVSRQSARRQR